MDHASDTKLVIVCSFNHKSRTIATIYRHHPELPIQVIYMDKSLRENPMSKMRIHAQPTPEGYFKQSEEITSDQPPIAELHSSPHSTYLFRCTAPGCKKLEPVKLTDKNVELLFGAYRDNSRATCELSYLRATLNK
jgi:hypothetical protein